MNQETMIKILTILIDVYDASDELLELSQKLSGCCVDSDSLVMRIMYISEAIKWFSPLYQAGVDRGVDWEESAVGRILERRELTAEERAVRLLCDCTREV